MKLNLIDLAKEKLPEKLPDEVPWPESEKQSGEEVIELEPAVAKDPSRCCNNCSDYLEMILVLRKNMRDLKQQVTILVRQYFRTGPYFIMHTLLCFKKTIAIPIDVLWDCGALFFLFRGFLSLYGLKKNRWNFCLKYGKSISFSCNFGTFPAMLPIFQF